MFYKKAKNHEVKGIFFFYTFSIFVLVILGFSALYLFNFKPIYFIITRIYNILEYVLLAYFFSYYIENKIIKNLLRTSVIPFFAFCLYDFFNASTPQLPYLPITIEHIALLTFLIYFFFEVMRSTKAEPIYERAIFWIAVAFILDFSGNFFLFLYSKSQVNNNIKNHFTVIYTLITVIKNILLCISVFIRKEPIIKIEKNYFS